MLQKLSRSDRQRAAQRAYRQRQRDGEGIAPVTYTAMIIEFLITTRWLAESDAGDRAAIGKAMSAALAEAAKQR
jgi:hypothetical protein